MAGFCVSCGAALSGTFCNKCGARAISAGDRAPTSAPAPVIAPPVASTSSGLGKVLLWVGGILLLLVVIGTAAAMYGVGVRLDHAPEMLFTLRRVSLDELLASAVTAVPATPAAGRVLATGGLASLFGIELVDTAAAAASPDAAPSSPKAKPQRRSGAAITRSAGRVAPGAGKRAASSKPAAPSKRAVPSKAARKRAAPSNAATPSKPVRKR